MAQIQLGNDIPGMAGLMKFKPAFAAPLNALVEALLRSENSTLTRGEREFLFTAASWINGCKFCAGVHAAMARVNLEHPDHLDLVRKNGPCELMDIDPKMHELLHLTAEVAGSTGHRLTTIMPKNVELAREAGATDEEIHDAVLIASAACMLNRYVDALATLPEADTEFYANVARKLNAHGYHRTEEV